jgi:hypothetical protein
LPRKRIRSKSRSQALNNDQFMDLWLCQDVSGRKHGLRPFFPDAMQRRVAWFQHRDEFMPSADPGRRPGGWWSFEHPKIPRLAVEADFEYLWRAGVMDKDEQAAVLAQWTRMLDLHGELIKMVIADGDPRGYLAGLHRQAVLLGDVAVKQLEQVLTTESKEDKENDNGCIFGN